MSARFTAVVNSSRAVRIPRVAEPVKFHPGMIRMPGPNNDPTLASTIS